MEVELADVVLAYIDVLEARGELDLETATEFLVLVAALLELKSRLLLPREDDDLLDIEPAEAAEELLARLLDAHRYRGAAEHLAERLERESGHRYRSGAAAARAAPHRSRRRGRRLQARAARQGARRAAARAPAARPSPPQPPEGLGRRAPRAPARAAAPRPLHVRRGRPGRRPRDGRGDALRAAGALQARRGDLEPGRARSARSRSSARDVRGRRACCAHERAGPHRRGAAVPQPGAGRARGPGRRVRGRRPRRSRRRSPSSRRALAGRGHRAAARRRRLRAGDRSGGRGRRAAPAGQAAHPAADAGAGRDARDRRVPAARVAAGDHPHPRRERRLRDRDAARARAHRGGRALAVRRRALPHDAAVPHALRARRGRPTCPRSRRGTRRPRRRARCATGSCARARRAPPARRRSRCRMRSDDTFAESAAMLRF